MPSQIMGSPISIGPHMNRNKNRRRIAFALSSLLAHFVTPLINVILSVVIIRTYASEFWGTYVQHLLWLSLLLTLINWGSKEFLLKKFSERPAEIGRWLLASIAGKCLMFLWISPIGWFCLQWSEPSWLLPWWLLARMSWQFFEVLNIYRRFFLQVAAIELLLTSSIIGIANATELSVSHFMMLIAIADGVKAITYLLLHRKYLKPRFSLAEALQFLALGLPYFLLALAGLMASRAELYLLSFLKNKSMLAQYQILGNFVQYAHLFAASILMPFLQNLYRINKAAFDRYERQFIVTGSLISGILTGSIFGITTFLYQFTFSYPTFILVYFNIWGFYFYFLRIQANFRDNKIFRTVLIVAVMGLVNAMVAWLLIPTFGIPGTLAANLSGVMAGIIGFRTGNQSNS